jgi:hypothetical protein
MAELFRYIQQAFVVPSTTQAIDVDRQSDLQNSLRDAISKGLPPDRLRSIADDFIVKHFSSPLNDPFQMGKQLLSVSKLIAPPFHGTHAINQLISKVFGRDASELVGSNPFLADKALLDDTLVCVKITTAFDRVNAHNLVAMRQAIAFIEDFAADKVTDVTAEGLRKTLRRPIRIPTEFVKSLTVIVDRPQSPPAQDPATEAATRHRTALMNEQRHLRSAYEAIMGLPPDHFELTPFSVNADRGAIAASNNRSSGKEVSAGEGPGSEADAVSAPPTFLAIPKAAIERFGGDVRKTLEKANIDVTGAPVSHVITAIKRRWQNVSQQLAPYQVPASAKVFRVGVHLFAVQDNALAPVPGTKEAL